MVLRVPKDTLTVEEDPANKNKELFLPVFIVVESSNVTLRLATLTLTVTVQLREKSIDPSKLLPEVEKLTVRAVERAHTCLYHQLAVNTVESQQH